MFEMVAALNSIVLLSALPKEVRERYDKEIWTQGKRDFAKVTFGKWMGLYRRLANLYLELDKDKKNGEELFQSFPFGKEFYLNLSDNKLLKSLDAISAERNKDAHSGITPEIVANIAVQGLHSSLIEVFGMLTAAYSAIDLIYPQSMKRGNGLYTISTKKLQGTNYPFAEEEIQTEIDMNTAGLYLLNPVSGHRLELLPELVKIIHCKGCGHWAVFFFYKVDSKNAHYISYQNEIHDFTEQVTGLLHSFK